MLAFLGFATIAIFMIVVMTGRLSAYSALILIPLAAGTIAGGWGELGTYALEGVTQLAPTAALLMFAVLFFSVMIDAGLFRPLENAILRFAGTDPQRIVMGTALLALLVSLDGDGATTILIVTTAFLPLYRRTGVNPMILAVVLACSNTVMNLSPWGGPTGRAAGALRLDVAEVFLPLVPVMGAGIIMTIIIAWYLGRSESRRLALLPGAGSALHGDPEPAPEKSDIPLTWRYAVNLLLTLGALICAILHLAPLAFVFMIALALGLLFNFPDPGEQRERFAAHAANALPLVILILAAGAFTGILDGTGMLAAMAQEIVSIIPVGLGPWIGPVIALLAIPFTFLLSNDAYYFGIVPILAEVAAQHGVGAAEVARASLLAQPVHALSPLVPALYLSCSILNIGIGEFQRFALKWALLLTGSMILTATILGVIW